MTSSQKKVDLIVSGIMVAICAYNIVIIFSDNIYPSVPEIIIKDKTLEEMKFPICFLLCLNDILEEDSPSKFTKYGYRGVEYYFTGRKKMEYYFTGQKKESFAEFGWSNKSKSLMNE